MIANARPILRLILFEGTGTNPIPTANRFDLLHSLLDKGFSVLSTSDANIDTNNADALIIMGHFQDATPEDVAPQDSNIKIKFIDVTELPSETLTQTIESYLEELQVEVNQPGKWKPWFPVIDFDRCTNCMQCLSFCLFDVYGVSSDNKIQVQNNSNCKTDCPACSRVCPEVAIMFPKYGGGPINGADVSEDDVVRETLKVDISSLLGGDIYGTLRDRSESAKQRFARERDDNRALNERKRCLKKLSGLDIPKEVFNDLPSPDEIRNKAEIAKQKAEAARSAIEAEQTKSSE